jgi:hypothetical protein
MSPITRSSKAVEQGDQSLDAPGSAPDLRIVSWNMQRQGAEQGMNHGKLFKMLDDLGANVLLAQEPPRYLESMTTPRSQRGAAGGWTVRRVEGGTQGTMVVATKNGKATCTKLDRIESPSLGQGTKLIGRDNPIAKVTLHGQAAEVTLATFHAPYDCSIRDQFVRNALTAAAAQKNSNEVDLVMGDFNTYGTHNPDYTHNKGNGDRYVLLLASPTSGAGKNAKGGSGPLDKIVGKPWFVRGQRGRIVPKSGAAKPAAGAPSGPSVRDIIFPSWDTMRSVPSDHLPIYVDVGGDTRRLETGDKRPLESDHDGQTPKRQRYMTNDAASEIGSSDSGDTRE